MARDIDILLDIPDQGLFRDVIKLRPYEAKDQKIETSSVKVMREVMDNVDLLSALVRVETNYVIISLTTLLFSFL